MPIWCITIMFLYMVLLTAKARSEQVTTGEGRQSVSAAVKRCA